VADGRKLDTGRGDKMKRRGRWRREEEGSQLFKE
jgi:hypothetical protein